MKLFTAADIAEIRRSLDERFELAELRSTRRHFVYRAYDAEGRCLYVGCTNNPRRRRQQHRKASLWFEDAAHCVMTGPLLRSDAYALETEQIRTLQPIHNRPRPLPPAVIKKQQRLAAAST